MKAIDLSDFNFNWEEFKNASVFQTGYFNLQGPYQVLREGQWLKKISQIEGRIIPVPKFDVVSVIDELGLKLSEPIIKVLPFEEISSAGNLSGPQGEAFIVPDGWVFPGSENGPALNNMTEQLSRFRSFGIQCLSNIFEDSSLELLLSIVNENYDTPQIKCTEYQLHEVGHSVGLGLKRKLSQGTLCSPWYRAVEEWRSDGVEFAIANHIFTKKKAGQVILANYALRFGIDAHRRGGIELDTDVNAALLTFNSLLDAGALKLDTNGKLEFVTKSYEFISEVSKRHAAEAIDLTRRETLLDDLNGIWMLYAGFPVSNGTKILFQKLIREPNANLNVEIR